MKTKWPLIFIVILGFIFWSFFAVQSVSAACTGTVHCGHIECDGGRKYSVSGATCTVIGSTCLFGGGTCTCYLPVCRDTGVPGEGWKDWIRVSSSPRS